MTTTELSGGPMTNLPNVTITLTRAEATVVQALLLAHTMILARVDDEDRSDELSTARSALAKLAHAADEPTLASRIFSGLAAGRVTIKRDLAQGFGEQVTQFTLEKVGLVPCSLERKIDGNYICLTQYLDRGGRYMAGTAHNVCLNLDELNRLLEVGNAD